ncbi:MAG: 3-deoxy-D-manno-octulosonic acid transferase [Lentisphaeria bacterium]|nr:3-deoxy-D-manno-octulosonic acid transferase [Lentisphaeria bacterium]
MLVMLLYNLLFPCVFLLYSPFYLVHLLRRGGLGWDFLQRFGLFDGKTAARLRSLEAPVWIHAVSVGETVAALTFIRRLQQRCPETAVVLSSTTTTGHDVARSKAPAGVACIYCPVDIWPCVRRALRLVRPAMLVIFEVEIWPNLILQTAGSGAAVVLVNGRMSDRSSASYARWSMVFRRLFGAFRAICVQTEADAERVRRVAGAEAPVHVCSTMKFDQVPETRGKDMTAVLDAAFGPGPRVVFCAGSTHPGEEEMVCAALCALRPDFPELRLVLVPRHHERTAEIEPVLEARHLSYRLLAPREDRREPEAPVDVLLVNTMGALMDAYAACDVAYVGKSLAGNRGGHNIIEPAIFGKPILHGPEMQNFRAVAAIFREARAVREVASAEAFPTALRELLADPALRTELGGRARGVVEACRGAVDRTLEIIEPFLGGAPHADDR